MLVHISISIEDELHCKLDQPELVIVQEARDNVVRVMGYRTIN